MEAVELKPVKLLGAEQVDKSEEQIMIHRARGTNGVYGSA